MKNFKNCFSAIFLSCFIVFGNVSGCYLEVHAFEWTAPETFLPFDGALPYLMGLLGVFPKDKSTFNPEQWKDDYISDLESQGFDVSDKSEFGEWVENISKGALDQSSIYWEKFKEWLQGKFYSGSPSIEYGSKMSTVYDNLIKEIFNETVTSNVTNSNCYGFYVVVTKDSSGNDIILQNNIRMWTSETPFTITMPQPNSYAIQFSSNSTSWYNSYSIYKGSSNSSLLPTWNGPSSLSSFAMGSLGVDGAEVYVSSNFGSLLSGFDNVHVVPFSGAGTIPNEIFVSLDPSIINSLSLALSSAISDSIPGVIPLPWDNVGANENELEDEYDAVLEGIQAGTLDIADAMAKIQDLLGLLTVSDTGKLYPENPDKPDETLQDKVNENTSNDGFVLSGLEKVFPFCIPFDLYAFITLLEASPVAPVIEYPIYNPVSKSNEIITIDFSTWESVVVLFRYIFDFLFIIGLLLIARALIGGGDSA